LNIFSRNTLRAAACRDQSQNSHPLIFSLANLCQPQPVLRPIVARSRRSLVRQSFLYLKRSIRKNVRDLFTRLPRAIELVLAISSIPKLTFYRLFDLFARIADVDHILSPFASLLPSSDVHYRNSKE